MIHFIRKLTLPVFLLVLVYTCQALAGTTGKIAGKIIDKSGAALPGVVVIVEGSVHGATSDVEGLYTILNIPPGKHTVRASMVGYKTVSVTQVQVNIDQTTRLDFEMTEEAITTGEITVVASRPLVEKDVSGSVSQITAQEVKTLPVSNITGAVALQAGVENGFVIRGGAADQSLFLVDGMAMRDSRNNQPVTQVALSAIQEVSLERGGFNAEYGQVRSGILNVVTKEGDKEKYEAAFTLRYSAPHDKFFDSSPFDPNSYFLRSYLDPTVAFTGTKGSAWDEWDQKQYPTFIGWNEVSRQLMTDDDPSNDLTPMQAQKLFEWQHRKRPTLNKPDYDIDAGFGGPVPLIGSALGNMRFFASYKSTKQMLLIPLSRDDYRDYNGTLKITSDINDAMKLSVSTVMGKSYNVAVNGDELQAVSGSNGGGLYVLPNYETYITSPDQIVGNIGTGNFISTLSTRVFTDSWYSQAEVSHFGLAGNFTHVLGSNTFYNVSVNYFQRQYQTGPIAPLDEALQQVAPGVYANSAPFGFSNFPNTSIGDGMFFGGHTSTTRDSTKTSSLTVKFDLTSQVNFNNQIKAGFEFNLSTLDLNYAVYKQIFPESNYFIKSKYTPVTGAFYVQDKIEFNGFIANLGVRLDYSDPNVKWATMDPFSPNYFGQGFRTTSDYPMQNAEKQLTVSPRIGISHPITENSKLYFNYGHFKQLPNYEDLFQLSRGSSNQVIYFGNPNLAYAKTISYELGYDQALLNDYLIQVAGYYRDIKDQLATTRFVSADGSISYVSINSNNYQDVRGFEITLKKLRGDWVKGFASYTYDVSSQGRFGFDQIFQDPSQQANFNRNIGNFAQNKPIPQPWANIVLTFTTPADFGPKLGGIDLFSDWAITFIGNWRDGYWATRNPKGRPNVSQNVKARDYYNLNMRVSKDFDLGGMVLTFLVDVNNAFNIRRFSGNGFSDNTDVESYWNSLHLPQSDAYDNITGDDKYADFRDPSVAFQPIEVVGSVTSVASPSARPFYYEKNTGQYMQYNSTSKTWAQVEQGKLDQVLKDKAYIDMPNITSFNFLNPRQIYFGISTSIKL